MAGKSGVSVEGVKEADAYLDKIAAGVKKADKPVFVGTVVFYAPFQERGTRRGVSPRRFLEKAAQTVRSTAKRVLGSKLETGELLAGLVELARKARTVAASGAPSERGKLRRSIKVQVGGTLRRSR